MDSTGRFTIYKGYRLLHPAWSDLNKERSGRYSVVVLLKKQGSPDVLRIPIPYAFGWTYEDAVCESIEHGKRLIDGDLVPDTPPADVRPGEPGLPPPNVPPGAAHAGK